MWSARAYRLDVPAACVPFIPIVPAVELPCPRTKAVVAICVVFVLTAAVVESGVPVKVGDARGAKPEMLAPDGMVTVPVKVGDARGA